MHRQGQFRERRKTIFISAGIAIAKSSPPPKATNTQQPKEANTTPKATCQSHLSTPAPETSRKVSTVEYACPYTDGPTTTEQQWQAQNATQSFPTLPISILIGWTYHHRTEVAGPKRHTVNPHPSNLHPYHLHPSIMSDENLFHAFMDVVNNSSPFRIRASIYHIRSRVVKNLLDEYEYHQIPRTRQEKEPLVDTKNQNQITIWSQERLGLNQINWPYTNWELLIVCQILVLCNTS